jgi:hypothetical protein
MDINDAAQWIVSVLSWLAIIGCHRNSSHRKAKHEDMDKDD